MVCRSILKIIYLRIFDPAKSTNEKTESNCFMALLGLLKRKQCWFPSVYGWLLIGVVFFVVNILFMFTAQPFLAPNHPIKSEILVVEGWVPDYVFELAKAEFESKNYKLLFVTGEPTEKGSYLTEFNNFAEIGAKTLLKLGMNPDQVVAVPAPFVVRDRTYETALALKKWFHDSGMKVNSVNLLSLGAHSRRSRMLFEKALDFEVKVGIIAVTNQDYNPKRWWRYGDGVRTTISEAIAYVYARFLFHPE